ncbi:MAG: hypothetical protein IPM39_00380 [Chloroflexi bacterium]|nr:hypothetical protein [Chloroflexota bacterium]
METGDSLSSAPPRLPRSPRFKKLALAVLLLWLATWLRFHHLGAQSFWNDEGNSARLSERTIQLILEGTASDIHPPLYYLLLRGWRELLGDTEFALRALSAFAGLLVVPLALAGNRQLSIVNRQSPMWLLVGLLVGLITAVSPPLIYYSQEARMYALLGLLAALATWLLLRIADCGLRIADHRSRITFMTAYVLTAAAGLYTHYFFPAVLAAHGVVVVAIAAKDWFNHQPSTVNPSASSGPIVHPSASSGPNVHPSASSGPIVHPLASSGPIVHRPSSILYFLQWAAMMAVVFLLYLPWLPTFLANVGGGGAIRPSLLPFLADTFFWLGFGATVGPPTIPWSFVALGVLLVIGLVFNWGWQTAVALITLLVPILFLYLSGATSPQYFKFLTAVIVPFALVVGGGWRVPPDEWRTAGKTGWLLPAALFLLYFFGVSQSLHNLYNNPAYARADYRAMAARILAENWPDAGIILNAPNQWEVFTYYHRHGAPVYPLPLQGMAADAVAAELSAIAANHDRLYVIYWGDAQQDPQRWVERWLDEHTFKATEEWVKDVRFAVYAVPDAPATEMETLAAIPFGSAITLQGYTLGETTLAPGEIAQVTLFWQTAVPLAQRYKVFLHLVGEDGPPVAQRDSEPGGALKPTTIWPPGETISDNHGLLIPADLPPGSYTLLLGLYDLADPTARLPVAAETAVNNALPLAQITVIRSP